MNSKDFQQKYSQFFNSLDAAQRAIITRSLPTLHQAMKTFGPDVDEEELIKLFGGGKNDPVIAILFSIAHRRTD